MTAIKMLVSAKIVMEVDEDDDEEVKEEEEVVEVEEGDNHGDDRDGDGQEGCSPSFCSVWI